MGWTRIQTERFNVDDVLAELSDPRAGGVTSYVGSVRGDDDGRPVDALEYEAFPEMAERELERLRQETLTRFRLLDAIVIHRTGRLAPGEPILLVALSGRHRAETFQAVAHFMDELKQRIPIWKREHGQRSETWILGAENRRVPR